MNMVVAYEMAWCEGIYLQCDQLSVEGCNHGIHRKVPFQEIVGVKI
jgi:hypothetical protein